ncbi:MAG TPA: sigma-54-dependent Fis family transcriptional regulator, partial [Candidatus Coatesbacteria bacterium]|nr:sigma-54-dependent Fis family transcriptional regulator [Candidatus Coatesbacteria bacterium]
MGAGLADAACRALLFEVFCEKQPTLRDSRFGALDARRANAFEKRGCGVSPAPSRFLLPRRVFVHPGDLLRQKGAPAPGVSSTREPLWFFLFPGQGRRLVPRGWIRRLDDIAGGKMATILVVEDEANLRRALCRGVEERGHRAVQAGGLGEARRRLLGLSPDAVLLDLKLPDGDGLELLGEITAARPGTPVVILTAYGDVDTAVRALKAGAEDFFEKPFELEALTLVLERLVEKKRLRDEVASLRERLGEAEPLGDSPAWRAVLETVRRVAPTGATVLFTGESGTGKEVAARALHRLSGREGVFVAVHAAALPAELLESELFGHARGAFS